MDPHNQRSAASILHNAARNYCIQRILVWKGVYADLTASGRDHVRLRDDVWEYTKEARGVFPRYNVLDAILLEVERWVPEPSTSLDETRIRLAVLAAEAEGVLTKSRDPVAIAAINDERNAFKTFLRDCDIKACAALPQLPFRRVLAKDEHDMLRAAFDAAWGNCYGGVVEHPAPPPYLTLHTAVMDAPGASDMLRGAIADLGVARVLEFLESAIGYELDLAFAEFRYKGLESQWTSGDHAWMVYVSHESSITLGGEHLIAAMLARVPDLLRYKYRGFDRNLYSLAHE
jgi:hypothetical protein